MNDKEKGPIVFNIKIITSWKPTYATTATANNNNNGLLTEQQQEQQLQRISKYIRQDMDTLNQNINSGLTNNNNSTTTLTFRAATMIINTNDDYPLHTSSIKGKSKETRKRKSCE
ncbi:unnamed protein product [Cunninghamella echinulata]